MLSIKNYKVLIYQSIHTNNNKIEWIIDNVVETEDVYEIFVSEALNKPNHYVFVIDREKYSDNDELIYSVIVYRDKNIVLTSELNVEDIDSRLGMLSQLQFLIETLFIKL